MSEPLCVTNDDAFNTILERTNARERGGKWQGHCPGHDDEQSSLSIGQGRNGGIVLHCHAGCTPQHVCESMGLTLADLMPDKLHTNGNGAPRVTHRQTPKAQSTKAKRDEPREIVATYPYRDEQGNVLYEAVRYEPKTFRQRRPDGNGGYVWSMDGVRRVPYALPELLAEPLESMIHIVEGEKDADRLRALGMCATTNVAGAGDWRDEYAEHFKGRRVVIIPDNDEAGRKHAAQVAESVGKVAAEVRVLELANVSEKGDVSDWLNAGHDDDELRALAERAPTAAMWLAGPVQAEADTPQPVSHWRANLFTVGQFLNRPPKEWHVRDVLGVQDMALIYGEPGSGKTFVVLDLSFSLATGRTFADSFDVAKPLAVAYCTSEGVSGLADRLRAVSIFYDTTDVPFSIFTDAPQLYDRTGENGIMTFVHEWQTMAAEGLVPERLDVLVIDTMHGATAGADENSAKDAGIVLASLRHARDALGCACVLVHHANKSGQSERGSTALRGAMDSVLRTSKTGSAYVLKTEKLKDGAPWEPKAFRLAEVEGTESVRVEWHGNAADNGASTARPSVAELISAYLRTHKEQRFTAAELALLVLGDTNRASAADNALERLVKAGAIVKETQRRQSGAMEREVKTYYAPE